MLRSRDSVPSQRSTRNGRARVEIGANPLGHEGELRMVFPMRASAGAVPQRKGSERREALQGSRAMSAISRPRTVTARDSRRRPSPPRTRGNSALTCIGHHTSYSMRFRGRERRSTVAFGAEKNSPVAGFSLSIQSSARFAGVYPA